MRIPRTHHRVTNSRTNPNNQTKLGKLKSNPSRPVPSSDCQKNGSAASFLWLHSTSLSPNSFVLSLTSAAMAKHAHPFVALLDSGLSHCFVDESFASQNRFTVTNLLNPILLQLFDSSTLSSVSKKKTIILITFSTGETQQINCYITKLEKGYATVLGYDWLVQHNPRINWTKTEVMFSQTPTQSLALLIPNPTLPQQPSSEKLPTIDICLVSAHNFTRLSQKKGNTLFLAHSNPTPNITISA